MISEIIVILIFGSILAALNRSHMAATKDGAQDEVWAAFEAALKSSEPAKNEATDQDPTKSVRNIVGQVRTSIPMGDTIIKHMDIGSVGFIQAEDALIDDHGNIWLSESGTVFSQPSEGSLAVSRQPEGWFLQRYAQPGGQLGNEKEAVRVIGHFDFR